MTLVALCIILAWPVAHALNRRAIERIAGHSGMRRSLDRLNGASALAGTTAGGALGALAIVTLETHDGLHVLLSKVFFGAQVLALICDSLLAQRLRRLSRPAAMPAGTGARLPICVAVLLLAAYFLFMFFAKDSGLIADRMMVRWLYVGSENLLCGLLLLYSLTYLSSLRQERPARAGLIDLGDEASRRLGRG